jgi:hypothetical protein
VKWAALALTVVWGWQDELGSGRLAQTRRRQLLAEAEGILLDARRDEGRDAQVRGRAHTQRGGGPPQLEHLLPGVRGKVFWQRFVVECTQ